MLTRIRCLLCIVSICFGVNNALGQASAQDFQRILKEKGAFNESDFVTLERDQAVVRLGPVSDKREVAVLGILNVQAGADEFLRSYRDGMTRKNNAAILEIGSFAREPGLADLQNLTFETQDIEDLKECAVGDCEVKLSASMIERFRKEVNWQAPDYSLKATQLYKQMLLDYVRDYRVRGEEALIEYNDKRTGIDLAAEQRVLNTAPGYISHVLATQSDLLLIEDALVWSKIKFGLKPVIAINHILIYRRDREVGPQVVVASNQIYANHYFNAFQALTAFVGVTGANQGYLVYENRSRADGLEGPFSKVKRNVVEKKALEGLRAILAHSKSSLDGSTGAEFSSNSNGWRQRLFGGIRPLLWVLVLSALIALLVLGRLRSESATARKGKPLKPESAKS
jgi:hypothetical protein